MEIRLKQAGAVVLALWGTVAQAQENWAGYYGGISIDAVKATSDVGGNAVHQYKDKTANLGIYGGYNFVRSNGFVWGPEISLTSISTEGTRTDATLGGSQFDGGFLLMPRLRGGFATDRAFFYGIAGLGITDAMARPAGASGTDVVISPSLGLGAEFAMGNGWRTKIEAVHHKFDSSDFNFNGTTTPSENKLTQITLGLSRKF
ncbi:MAG: porin family protein [Sulfitobacter sp.]